MGSVEVLVVATGWNMHDRPSAGNVADLVQKHLSGERTVFGRVAVTSTESAKETLDSALTRLFATTQPGQVIIANSADQQGYAAQLLAMQRLPGLSSECYWQQGEPPTGDTIRSILQRYMDANPCNGLIRPGNTMLRRLVDVLNVNALNPQYTGNTFGIMLMESPLVEMLHAALTIDQERDLRSGIADYRPLTNGSSVTYFLLTHGTRTDSSSGCRPVGTAVTTQSDHDGSNGGSCGPANISLSSSDDSKGRVHAGDRTLIVRRLYEMHVLAHPGSPALPHASQGLYQLRKNGQSVRP